MKVRCKNKPCEWKGDGSETLTAPHPFRAAEEVDGCPACLEVDTTVGVCDTPGCWEPAAGECGRDGHFLLECAQHWPKP